MKRILVATITENDQCSSFFASSLTQSVRIGLASDVEVLPVFYRSMGNWAMAANQAMTLAWQKKLDGVVFADPSVSWQPEALMDLCKTNKDAVALPVSTSAGFDISLGEISRIQEDEGTGEIKVRAASLQFFFLSSYALEKLAETHPSVSYYGGDVKLILQSGDIYASYHTHEEVLSYRLWEINVEIWVNPHHTVHRHEYAENGADFAQALQQLREHG